MSGYDDQTSGNLEENLNEDYTDSLIEVEKSVIRTLVKRGDKIINGDINGKKRKIIPRRWHRIQGRAENEKLNMRSSDSGLGRTSMEGDSSSTERGSQSSQDGVNRAVVAAKREEMARLEKELEQEMRYR